MRKVIGVSLLVLALGCPAFAGVIQNPAPQPPATSTIQEPTADGEIQNPVTVEETTAEAVLTVITGLLALI